MKLLNVIGFVSTTIKGNVNPNSIYRNYINSGAYSILIIFNNRFAKHITYADNLNKNNYTLSAYRNFYDVTTS